MRILVFGAGAIGSLFGAKLSKYNEVTLLGREEHVNSILRRGLIVKGRTNGIFMIDAIKSLDDYRDIPDLVILTVKSYDTENASKEISGFFGRDVFIMSLQNGLDNVEKLKKFFDEKKIIIGLTTESCIFLKPGEIEHTGSGKTVIGSLREVDFLKKLQGEFTKAGFETEISRNILRDMWKKAIINACINPLTTIFEVKNGELKNEILLEIVKDVCKESVNIANKIGINLKYSEVIREVEKVIDSTSENISSMLQSIMKGKKTEIDSINGYMYEIGKKYCLDVDLNKMLVGLVKIREGFR